MKKEDAKNATIGDALLMIEDHGILTIMLYLEYGEGGTQGFGGYALYSSNFKPVGIRACGFYIWRLLEVVEVSNWKDLKGKNVRVLKDDNDMVIAIGHITRDKWFNPREELKEIEAQVALGTYGKTNGGTNE